MSEAATKEEGKEQGESTPGKSKKKLLIIVGAVLVLLGGGAAVMLGGGEEEKKVEESLDEVEEQKQYATAEMDVFIVNLSESTSFLKVRMLLEYDPEVIARHSGAHAEGGGAAYGGGGGGGGKKEEGPGAMPEALKARSPMIRDAVIRVVSSKRAQDVLTVQGKDTLKQELIEAINEAIGMEESPVVNLYFVEFIIQ